MNDRRKTRLWFLIVCGGERSSPGETRQGGPEGESRRWPAASEDWTRKIAEQLMNR